MEAPGGEEESCKSNTHREYFMLIPAHNPECDLIQFNLANLYVFRQQVETKMNTKKHVKKQQMKVTS